MAKRISTPSARKDLKPRKEPYWHELRRGGHVGFRKTRDGGSWIARWRSSGAKQEYKSLGTLADYDAKEQFDKAAAAANEWFEAKAKPDAPKGRATVEMAAKDYYDHLQAEKGERAKKDAEMRVNAYIFPKFKTTYLDALTTARLTRWRNAFVPAEGDVETLRKARATANRHLNTFKALLNYAWKTGLVADNTPWRKVSPFKKAGKARRVILDDKQIERLLESTKGGYRNLVMGLLLTGMRPGIEIQHILREQLHKDGTLEIRQSKTGPRTIYLSREAKQFFDELAKGKTPKAHLFTRDDGRAWAEKEAARTFTEVKKKAKLPEETVLYSLRHSYISRALENGASVKLVADNCGTSIRMIEVHYWQAIQKHRQVMLDNVPPLPAIKH